jgi:hypothetical protein
MPIYVMNLLQLASNMLLVRMKYEIYLYTWLVLLVFLVEIKMGNWEQKPCAAHGIYAYTYDVTAGIVSLCVRVGCSQDYTSILELH